MNFSSGRAPSGAFSIKRETDREVTVTEDNTIELPRLTVVLPIRNEERFIARTLDYILMQDYPVDRLEVLVIDGESDDRTRAIVSQYVARDQRVRLVTNPKRLSSAARALGVTEATGDVITFIDGHVFIDNQQLFRQTALLLRHQQVAVLSRPQFLETPDNTPFQQAVALARRSVIGHGLDSTIFASRDDYVDPSSSGATYRREVFNAVGNFDERFDACEDVEFNYRVARAGFRSYTSMRLAVYYYPRESIGKLFHQMARYGSGRFRLARKHPRTLSWSTVIPFGLVFGLPLLALIGLLWRPAVVAAATVAALYVLLILGTSVVLAARQGWRFFGVLPAIFSAIHTGLGWGFGQELWKTLIGRGVSFSINKSSEVPQPTSRGK